MKRLLVLLLFLAMIQIGCSRQTNEIPRKTDRSNTNSNSDTAQNSQRKNGVTEESQKKLVPEKPFFLVLGRSSGEAEIIRLKDDEVKSIEVMPGQKGVTQEVLQELVNVKTSDGQVSVPSGKYFRYASREVPASTALEILVKEKLPIPGFPKAPGSFKEIKYLGTIVADLADGPTIKKSQIFAVVEGRYRE